MSGTTGLEEVVCVNCGLKPGDIKGLTFHWEEGWPGMLCSICKDKPSPLMLEIINREIIKRLKKMGIKTVQCNRCTKEIFWLRTKNEKSAPVTLALINHFADCPHANKFRKKT